ncbi:ATP-dependent DNA helicase [Trichonephila clavipes]|uniref:ATP-dependent DNA helicase n=1 Tax=Trichonephila clavipes TaxID=2585209 RepID=A0A8X6SEC2_TRICX|nr:ATP-dependent DNA helicase [Trichonephila clavipes]
MPGDPQLFKTIDTIVDEKNIVDEVFEFSEYNKNAATHTHNLRMQIGSLVILLRNLNPPRLCNGTCLFIKRITGKLLEANTLTVQFKGEIVSCLPRVSTISPESPIPFKRLRFPIRLVFTMAIDKSQSQTISI